MRLIAKFAAVFVSLMGTSSALFGAIGSCPAIFYLSEGKLDIHAAEDEGNGLVTVQMKYYRENGALTSDYLTIRNCASASDLLLMTVDPNMRGPFKWAVGPMADLDNFLVEVRAIGNMADFQDLEVIAKDQFTNIDGGILEEINARKSQAGCGCVKFYPEMIGAKE